MRPLAGSSYGDPIGGIRANMRRGIIEHFGARVPPYGSPGKFRLTVGCRWGIVGAGFGTGLAMPNYRRALTAGGTWFFTVNLLERRGNDLLVRHIDHLRACFARERARRPFWIRGWVVLPEHMHWIWTLPDGDADFPTRWRRIKTDFVRGLPCAERRSAARLDRGERGIWQRRYWDHQIRDSDDFRHHLDYLHFNPVKHGWAAAPSEWPHSSFAAMVARGRYLTDWAAPVTRRIKGDE